MCTIFISSPTPLRCAFHDEARNSQTCTESIHVETTSVQPLSDIQALFTSICS
ncbi:hypothetical protein CTAM01_07014 [Colletotrichum tamarilloi]|uniref:Uncharacterized protein n=1 Tax=Colletotrichum tamarilloi TaxID=1209934 RepID=A0ABQ9R9U6_9PEZI|nr:uncharacterized protein CTAM01_07014 [Colletotrichum tamarilloi]KAK1499093.1 hypothetical protein CTAM01_07014 [Colletotrichum tamarilloi]